MGRPRLYNTLEEKLQARRIQSKKYYERNRAQICRRMRRKYKRKARRETEVKEQESTGSDGVRYKDQESTGSDDVMYDEISRFCMIDLNLESRLNDPIKTLNQAKIAFDEKTQGDKYKYIDDIVKECIASPGSALEFCKVTASMWVDLVDYIQSCLGKVLQEYGCGSEYNDADRVGAEFRHVMFLLEEIEEFLMTREGELADWHASGCLGYQICWEGEKLEAVST